MPIRAEYQTSASPSFPPETILASRKTRSPVKSPVIASSNGKLPHPTLKIKKTGNATAKASRGTSPSLMSARAIDNEKTQNKVMDKT